VTSVLLSGGAGILHVRVHAVLQWTARPSGILAAGMTFAEDRRVLVIYWLVGGRMTWEDAAELGGVSVATVGRWYQVFRRTGAFWPDDALGQQHYDNALFNPNFLAAVTSLIVDSLEALLRDISETLRQLSELPGWKGWRTRRRPCHACCVLLGTPTSVSPPTSASAAPIDVGSLPGRYAVCPSSAS